MQASHTTRTTDQKLAIFEACFTGLKHVYGTRDPDTGRARQVKAPVTERVILRHLKGEEPYGVYLLVGDQTAAVVADFDEEDTWPPLEFIRQARHYGIDAYLERSKSKGWHAWIFTTLPGVPAVKGRLVAKAILADIGKPATEVFPKQDRLADSTRYGNFIYTPLFGTLVSEDRTVFVDPDQGLKTHPDQWEVLENVRRVTEKQLDEIIEINELGRHAPTQPISKPPAASVGVASTFGLPPCAKRMLAEGVSQYQRVACFRLAVQLRKAGIPEDIAVAALIAWAAKNRPIGDKGIITDAEISQQTHWAYTRDYHGCGCEDPAILPYCQSPCPVASPKGNNAGPVRKVCPDCGQPLHRESGCLVCQGCGHSNRG